MTEVSAHIALQGVIPPMITPLTPDRDVDVESTERLVQHMITGGVSGIFVLGSSGEGPWLTWSQQRKLLETTIAAANGRVSILVGALKPSTSRTVETIKRLEQITGVDAVVVTTPYYFASAAEDQMHHFSVIASATKLPVVLYNIPPTTHTTIAPETVRELLTIDNIIGIKDSAGDMAQFNFPASAFRTSRLSGLPGSGETCSTIRVGWWGWFGLRFRQSGPPTFC